MVALVENNIIKADRNTQPYLAVENMQICFEDKEIGRCLKEILTKVNNSLTKMHIIDFESGIDEYILNNLYGSIGPSRAKQTYEYNPSKALLNVERGC